ncbi:uncharacterized protein LOC116227832 [Phasianus colchicus]|uniref:uncharacterized protein LOC116227832 n=1 Tax=Phasianus colchicus TaxID=9054 RepID=UPI00129DA2B5|nr:uncharacterized protein LOC116227832 [Phasianus colchicus]
MGCKFTPWQANSTLRMDLHHVPAVREKGWYLALMAPNTKGPHYAWLDPSRLYCHPQGLKDCVTDLLQPFQGDPIDLVAGIDAMGFILGAAVAATLHKGFLAIRKAGHLCVETLAEPYTDYSGREKVMEVRTDTVTPGELSPWGGHSYSGVTMGAGIQLCPSPGMRILLVDQWVETGGTMRAAIQLVERQGGVVAGRMGTGVGAPIGDAGADTEPSLHPAGVAAICIEDSEGGRWIREHYKCAHCVPPRLQPRFDQHQMGWE